MQASAGEGLARLLARELDGQVLSQEPLAPWTSVRVGGAAETLVRPSTVDALVRLLGLAKSGPFDLTVLGGGANTLVGDGGVPGAVLKLNSELFPEESTISSDEGRLIFGAGAAIARLVLRMKALRLVGAEFLAGIPGTLGGAVAMNAGTKAGECLSVVEAVEFATADGVGWVDRAQLSHGYRQTTLPSGSVITRVRFLLPKGDLQASAKKMEDDLAYRKRTQPLSQPNFGSVFTNPPGEFAGRLIESAGLKGHTIGRAQISTLHANWIVNLGGATAKDVVTLMELCERRVFEASGVKLTPEVKRVGVFL